MKKELAKTLASDAIRLLDQNSTKVLDRGSHPFSQWLEMRDEVFGLDIWFRVQQSGYSNGSSEVRVRVRGKLVLSAAGNGFYHPASMKVRTYKPGKWAETIQRNADPA